MSDASKEDIEIGIDGWVEGHASEAEALAVVYELDEDGYVVDMEGQRLEGAALGHAPPAVQMARARGLRSANATQR